MTKSIKGTRTEQNLLKALRANRRHVIAMNFLQALQKKKAMNK